MRASASKKSGRSSEKGFISTAWRFVFLDNPVYSFLYFTRAKVCFCIIHDNMEVIRASRCLSIVFKSYVIRRCLVDGTAEYDDVIAAAELFPADRTADEPVAPLLLPLEALYARSSSVLSRVFAMPDSSPLGKTTCDCIFSASPRNISTTCFTISLKRSFESLPLLCLYRG